MAYSPYCRDLIELLLEGLTGLGNGDETFCLKDICSPDKHQSYFLLGFGPDRS